MRLKVRIKCSGPHQTRVWDFFRRDMRDTFLGTSDPSSLFRSAERQSIIQHMLLSKRLDGGAELDDPLLRPAIVQHFPLHMHARYVQSINSHTRTLSQSDMCATCVSLSTTIHGVVREIPFLL